MVSILPLTLREVSVNRRGRRIIGPVSFELPRGGVTVVMGPNGAGKTTLLRAMHGIERLSSGEVAWQVPLDTAELRQSFVFQAPIILRRSVIENVAYPLRLRGHTRAEAQNRARDWVERIGLGDAAERAASGLSGGERQKLALARALVVEPEIIFLDEPTANLDGFATREIETLVQDAHANGMTVVLATHNLGQARRLGTEVMFVHHGRVTERSGVEAFFETPKTEAAAAFVRGDIVQ